MTMPVEVHQRGSTLWVGSHLMEEIFSLVSSLWGYQIWSTLLCSLCHKYEETIQKWTCLEVHQKGATKFGRLPALLPRLDQSKNFVKVKHPNLFWENKFCGSKKFYDIGWRLIREKFGTKSFHRSLSIELVKNLSKDATTLGRTTFV